MDKAVAAIITELPSKDNGYSYRVVTEKGETHLLSGLGAPQGGHLGEKGILTYQSGPSYGLYFWTSEKKENS